MRDEVGADNMGWQSGDWWGGLGANRL